MGTISLKDARRRLGDLVRAAARGESTVITVRGKETATIGPIRNRPLKKLPDLTEFRASVQIKGRSVTDELLAMRREERH